MTTTDSIRNAIRIQILELAANRGPQKTICPSEVALAVGSNQWRALMPEVRAVANELALQGSIRVLQRGAQVSSVSARGPIRLQIVSEA